MSCKMLMIGTLAAALSGAQPQPRVVDPGGPGKAPSDAVVLFDGKDVSNWTTLDGQPSRCQVIGGVMACTSGVGHMYSRQKFGSAQIHLEFAPPLMPGHQDQMRGNSGVYLHGRYEIQVLDSFRNPTYPTGVCGALYGQAAPLVNAARPPEEWQTYDIIFHAPKCDASGALLARGRVTVLWNGVLVQDNVEIQDIRKGCAVDKIGDPGPLMLQDHSGFHNAPVTTMKFRNIWYRPLD